MKMNKMWMGALLAVLFLAGSVLPVQADSHGVLTGYVTGQSIYYWQGNINQIDVSFDTQDGLTWTLRCRRANANLGLCSNLTMNFYTAEGTFSQHGILELESMSY